MKAKAPPKNLFTGPHLLIGLFIIATTFAVLYYSGSIKASHESHSTTSPPKAADAALGEGDAIGATNNRANSEKEVLYWYDPMYPGTHFDAPGKSPFMDMDLVPRYRENEEGLGITIDPAQLQNLGLKTVPVKLGKLSFSGDYPANVEFNSYEKANIQPRADGFVSSVTPLAVGDYVEVDDELAIITVPGWASDQSEYLLLKKQNAPKNIIEGVREKLRLSGMPQEMLDKVESTGKVQTELSIKSPVAGVITELNVFMGMNVDRAMTLAVIQGTSPIWVTAFVPERDLNLTTGRARITLPAFPSRAFEILEMTVLPQADPVTRNVPVRFKVKNEDRLLRPGLSAQVRFRATGAEGLIIPTQSLIDLGDTQRVIVMAADGSFVPKAVKKGASSNDETLITEGLVEGEEIVTVGLFLIDSEANLRGALERLGGENNF